VTLKRIWGKVKYDSLPNPHTLDILARFAGYDNWRDLRSKNGNGSPISPVSSGPAPVLHPAVTTELPTTTRPVPSTRRLLLLTMIAISLVVAFVLIIASKPKKAQRLPPADLNPADYSFTSKKAVSTGIPNSVVFDYDASHAPGDSVIIQQSWDRNLRSKVSKSQHQHTSIYYYPDFYYAKLIVEGRIVRQQELFLQTDGWLPMVMQTVVPVVMQGPVPVYFKKEEAISKGIMGLSPAQLEGKHIDLQPKPPYTLYANVRDFGEIYSDDFDFETSLKDDYSEGAAVCQQTKIYLLCQGTAIWIPLCAKGCVSDIDLLFAGAYASGKRKDLSAFGVDFSAYNKIRIESHRGIAKVLINDKSVYQLNESIQHSKIIGIEFLFEGTGKVDYVRLSNKNCRFDDEF
jgi:hypothetical protein